MRTGLKQSILMKSLWWKKTWWFQWAHKPLCDRFHRETFRFGQLHLCRSCTLLYSALAIALVLILTVTLPESSFGLILPAFISVLAVSHPKVYRYWSRGGRDLLRAGFGFLFPLTLFTAWKIHWAVPLLIVGGLWLVWGWYSRVRSAGKPRKCEGCPEFANGGVCSGYQKQTAALRAYEEAATELVYQLQLPPHVHNNQS